MRSLYRSEVVGDELDKVREELAGEHKLPAESRSYALALFDRLRPGMERVDGILSASLDRWDLKRLAVIDRCVLRIGAAELLFAPEVPTQVVINEAIEIARRFGSAESGRFVNGVLDRVARDHRGETA